MEFKQGEIEHGGEFDVLFDQTLQEAIEKIEIFKNINLVIGIPFYNEKETLLEVLRTVEEALSDIQEYRRTLIVCVGDPAGADVLEAIKCLDLNFPHFEFLMKPGSNGRGASIRAILEIADFLTADVLLFAADIGQEGDRGLKPDWIKRVLEPIENKYDFVLTTFTRHYLEDVISSFLVMPLVELFYGYKIRSTISGIYAVSHDLVEDLCRNIKFWVDVTRGYGIDPWLVTRVICWNKKICEVELGAKIESISMEKLNYIFKEITWAIFECIKRDEDYWLKENHIIRCSDIYGEKYEDIPSEPAYLTGDMVLLFKRSFSQYRSLYNMAIKEDLFKEVEKIVSIPTREFKFKKEIWADIVSCFLIEYCFSSDANRDDILIALTGAFDGRAAAFITHMKFLQDKLAGLSGVNVSSMLVSEANSIKEEQGRAFLKIKNELFKIWKKKALEVKPPLIPADYLEFVPGRPVILPKVIKGKGGRVVYTEGIFNILQQRYRERFENFVYNSLQVPQNADAYVIVGYVKDFMNRLEQAMDFLFPGNLYTEEGVQEVLNAIFKLLPHPRMFSVKNELFKEMLLRFPPVNVMIPANCKNPRELIEKMDVRDAVTFANLIETRKYADRTLLWILDNLRPESMEEVDIKHIVLGSNLQGIAKLGNISDLNKITTRIAVRPLNKGMGGDYPKLRFCLFIARHIMIAENYARFWRHYARERKNLGEKIRNSLIGRYETTAFSAHNIFENLHHRTLVRQFRALAKKLETSGRLEEARLINMMCDSYGLSQVLADGTFTPLSAWSWSSYSYKGGRGIPTPLSSHVEEKWFNHDLLEEIYKELGYDTDEINQNVIQLVGEGRASDNLLDVLLGIKPKDVTLVVQEAIDYPPANPLLRYLGNPILSPIKEHYWESKYVLNAAVFRIKDRVYILYRAYGDDEVSRIGLAIADGYNVLERLTEPIFIPQDEKEKKGCEDPRVAIINDEIYMLYTAYDGVIAQISAASIKIDDFLNKRLDKWQRKGFAFEDIWNKDAILFPEKFKGRYVIYHRIEPSIWLSYMDKLEFPVPKEKHSILLGPRSGMMWDSLKIGAGTQPIKTKYGWLLIYHGVDRERVYRLGVILVDLKNPERLLYRSPNPVLSPETEYEIGKEGESWVPNVVFTCGAVPAEDKDILDAEDEILVYYGAADTHICLATAAVGDLIPEEIRK